MALEKSPEKKIGSLRQPIENLSSIINNPSERYILLGKALFLEFLEQKDDYIDSYRGHFFIYSSLNALLKEIFDEEKSTASKSTASRFSQISEKYSSAIKENMPAQGLNDIPELKNEISRILAEYVCPNIKNNNTFENVGRAFERAVLSDELNSFYKHNKDIFQSEYRYSGEHTEPLKLRTLINLEFRSVRRHFSKYLSRER